MKVLTEKQRSKVLKELACIRNIATHLIFENNRETRIDYVNKIIEDVCNIAFDVCGERAATVEMGFLMYELQEKDREEGRAFGS